MNKTITTTKTNDEWEQTMVCEFASTTIAKLVLEDANVEQHNNKPYLVVEGYDKAKLQHEDKVITVTCKCEEHLARCWDVDPDTNQVHLEALAKEWQDQEQAWLPISRYLVLNVKPALKRTLKLTSNLIDEIAKLEKRLDGLNSRDVDILDCLGMDFSAIERLHKELSLHREQRFHFWGGKK